MAKQRDDRSAIIAATTTVVHTICHWPAQTDLGSSLKACPLGWVSAWIYTNTCRCDKSLMNFRSTWRSGAPVVFVEFRPALPKLRPLDGFEKRRTSHDVVCQQEPALHITRRNAQQARATHSPKASEPNTTGSQQTEETMTRSLPSALPPQRPPHRLKNQQTAAALTQAVASEPAAALGTPRLRALDSRSFPSKQ